MRVVASMSEPNAITDDAPSPWWPCPECGGIHFHTTVTWERGSWVEYPPDEPVWVPFDPPNAVPTGTSSHVVCADCGHEFDIAQHYEWPIVGERE